MREENDATTIRSSKRGGGAKWLIGAVAVAVVLGGGYLAWKTFAPSQPGMWVAANDPYASEPQGAGVFEPGQDMATQSATTDGGSAAPAAPAASADARTTTPTRRTTAPAAVAPAEETIGITPVSVASNDSDEIVVTAPRHPIWARRPSEQRLSALYPQTALERGREGEARLACTVQDGGALDCARVSATPGGFGHAAMRVASTFRHAPQLADGRDATGAAVNLHVIFRLADEPRRWRG